jgi:acyl-homoserine-lactone acylase
MPSRQILRTLCALVAAAGLPTMAFAAGLDAKVTRTRYGVAHVVASDWAGLGYGTGYAFAQDNFCLLADHLVTLSGERSKYFGPDAKVIVSFAEVRNIDSDTYYRGTFDDRALKAAAATASPAYRELVRGYVAGYNRYLSKTGLAGLPASCRNAAWVRPMTEADALRLNEDKMRLVSTERLLGGIVAATPPASAVAPKAAIDTGIAPPFGEQRIGYGSNGWAFGSDATGGAGLLLGNPHFPWTTTNRFWQVHQTIPGQLDVMGVTLSGLPSVVIGFNKDVAWTHTVSTDRHFTIFELTLAADDPMVYVVDGQRHRIETATVKIEVKDGAPIERHLYRSIYGPIVQVPALGLDWTAERAFAIKDAEELNFRSADAWLGIARARSVQGIRDIITHPVAIPWVNTIAADRHGDALYADVTPTPGVTEQTLKSCGAAHASPALLASRLYVLDGSRKACDWSRDPREPGLLPASAMPQLVRRDFVANSNDSFWLVNDRAPIRGIADIVGRVDEPQSLRTRAGLLEIHAALDARAAPGGEAVTPAKVKQMIFRNRNLAAELAMDDVLAVCEGSTAGAGSDGAAHDLGPACGILRAWDRHMDLDSRGAVLWNEFWTALAKKPGEYPSPAVAFDAADPVHTPRGLSRADGNDVRIRTALADAVALLTKRAVALDATWGSQQHAVRGERRVPIHGGSGMQGILNMQEAPWEPGVGYVPVHGSSYMQIVTFDGNGPVADAVLSYSQSTDPASPHWLDQTELYSSKQWNRLPFSAKAIAQQQESAEHIHE